MIHMMVKVYGIDTSQVEKPISEYRTLQEFFSRRLVPDARPVEKRAALTCSASPVSGGALLRVAGEEVESVRRELGGHLTFLRDILGDDPWARKW